MVSYHSIQRANERTRYTGKSAIRFIENGVERGKTADHFKQDEKRFLSELGYANCVAKAYNGYCFIVSADGECVTLYPLPEWFGKKRHYDSKTRIRNVRRYTAAYAVNL